MIDITHEELLSLRDAASSLPRRRRGRKIHVATLYRWSQRGIRGQRLETIQVGGSRCTSLAALPRFFARLSQPEGNRSAPNARRQKAIEKADAKLDAAGV